MLSLKKKVIWFWTPKEAVGTCHTRFDTTTLEDTQFYILQKKEKEKKKHSVLYKWWRVLFQFTFPFIILSILQISLFLLPISTNSLTKVPNFFFFNFSLHCSSSSFFSDFHFYLTSMVFSSNPFHLFSFSFNITFWVFLVLLYN